jgi:hypothetical protein
MLGRTLGSAALAIAVCVSISTSSRAQNLEAGKSPAQIFNGACAVCHKSPRGLVKSVPPGSLPGFLRQHYTTSSDMAGALSGYLLANGAIDRRQNAGKPRRGREQAPAAAVTPAAPAPVQNGWWPFQRQPAAQVAVPDGAGEPAQHSSRKHRTKHKKKSKPAPSQEAAPKSEPSHSAAGSDSAKPENASSSASKPEAATAAPKSSEPTSGEPKTAERKSAEPKAPEPKSSDSKAE